MPPQIRFEELWLVSLPKSFRSMRAVLTPLDDNAAAATEPLIPPPMISTSNASDSNFWICSFRSDISKVLNLEHHDRLVTVKLGQLKKMKHVIGIAGGSEKLEAILGAISGGIIHSLVTDETSAQKLI